MTSLILIILSLIAYYGGVKRLMYALAPPLAKACRLDHYAPLSRGIGLIELLLIACSHVAFCFALMWGLGLSPQKIGLTRLDPFLLLSGILLGVGTMALSSLVCRIVMEGIDFLHHRAAPQDLQSWLTLSRGGWMRHHINNIQMLPWYLSSLLVTLQIGSEETIFRGILITHFLQYGVWVGVGLPACCFIVMQAFQTPSLMVALFPLVGALVSSVIFSFLYLKTHALLPLIVAHLTFFIISIL